MTFRDISPHIVFYLTSQLMLTACWAPEVKQVVPKQSPAELAGLAIASASASSINSGDPTNETVESKSPLGLNPRPKTDEPTAVENAPQPLDRYPYSAKLHGANVPLLGHGGGLIMTLSETNVQSATIEVLEEKNGKLRVLCQGCSKAHPNQAGWISTEYLKRVD